MFDYCLMDCAHSWHSAKELTEVMDLVHYILNITGAIITNVKRKDKKLRCCCHIGRPKLCSGRLHQVKFPVEFSLKS